MESTDKKVVDLKNEYLAKDTNTGGKTISSEKTPGKENQWPSCSRYFPGYNYDQVHSELFVR